MYTKLKKLEEGFTIVEVLIVLAIAALILIIVLIAVPDLQRSSRNTDIYHDAQNLASAVQTFEGNNNGALPIGTSITPSNGTAVSLQTPAVVTIIGAAGTADATAHVNTSDIIDASGSSTTIGAMAVSYSTTSQVGAYVGPGELYIDVGALCNSGAPGQGFASNNNGGTWTLSSSSRSVAILYPIEGASAIGSAVGCIQE